MRDTLKFASSHLAPGFFDTSAYEILLRLLSSPDTREILEADLHCIPHLYFDRIMFAYLLFDFQHS